MSKPKTCPACERELDELRMMRTEPSAACAQRWGIECRAVASALYRGRAEENARLRAERDWQPIETAPRDGTELLLVDPTGRREVGFWSREGLRWSVFYAVAQPTHWMPLPEAPR